MVAELKRDPGVAYVETDRVRRSAEAVTPNDPMYTAGLQPELGQLNVPTAWETTTGSAVKVAVVDTGVNAVGDLTGAVLPGYDFVNNDSAPADDAGHGTTVASLIAARGNNNEGMAGVCWSCMILPVKVLDAHGSGYDTTIAKGIVWATQQGAQVINLSLGGAGSSTVLSNAITYANDRNVLVVAAAGNENSSVRSYPAAYTDVLAVGATARNSTARASFSNFNSATDKWVDVAAPGIVTAMDSNGDYNTGEAGTSFSTPLVAGIGALVKTAHPSYNGFTILKAIQNSATPIGSWVAYGMVNAVKAYTMGADTSKPTITGATPAQWARVRGTITVTGTGVADTGGSGLRGVDLYADGVWKAFDRTAPYSMSYNTAGRNGTIKLTLRVRDKAGNFTDYIRYVWADNTPPTVRITKAPVNKSHLSSATQKIYYTGSDPSGIAYYQLMINGGIQQTHTATTYPFTFVPTRYAKTMTVYVRAFDKLGNIGYSTVYTYYHY